jgi:hypothetical protein
MRRAAERVVSDYFDGDVSLRIEYLVPDRFFSVVARLRTVSAPSQVPETFIVKAATPTQPTSADSSNGYATNGPRTRTPSNTCRPTSAKPKGREPCLSPIVGA